MKRDMDLVRKILLAYEENEDSGAFFYPKIDGYQEKIINHHRGIMCDASLLEPIYHPRIDRYEGILGYRITWFGHDFLDASREETRWNKAKEIGVKIGGVTLEIMLQILKDLMLSQLKQVMP